MVVCPLKQHFERLDQGGGGGSRGKAELHPQQSS